MRATQIASLAGGSAIHFPAHVSELEDVRGRLGRVYHVPGRGRYAIFRETKNRPLTAQVQEPVVLVIGFRLRWIKNNRFFHWLFQRVCIVTTPFWSGLAGFGVKLWMVDRITKEYLGIYQWFGDDASERYLSFLIPVLRIFSVRGSIWHERYADCPLEPFLEKIRVNNNNSLTKGW